MREEYDFSKARKNPYAPQLKVRVTIRLDKDAITYFKAISNDVVPARVGSAVRKSADSKPPAAR